MVPHLIKWYPLNCNCSYKRKKKVIFSNRFHSPIALKLLIDNFNKSYCLYFQKMSQIWSFLTTHSIIFAEENPMIRGAWQAIVHGFTRSWTRLSDWTHTHTHTHTHTYFVSNLLRAFFFFFHSWKDIRFLWTTQRRS